MQRDKKDRWIIFIAAYCVVLLIVLLVQRVCEYKKYDSLELFEPASLPSAVSVLLVNINTASFDELLELPQIGNVLAKRIIEHRETNGSFKTIDEIKTVNGIGESIYSEIAPLITV